MKQIVTGQNKKKLKNHCGSLTVIQLQSHHDAKDLCLVVKVLLHYTL